MRVYRNINRSKVLHNHTSWFIVPWGSSINRSNSSSFVSDLSYATTEDNNGPSTIPAKGKSTPSVRKALISNPRGPIIRVAVFNKKTGKWRSVHRHQASVRLQMGKKKTSQKKKRPVDGWQTNGMYATGRKLRDVSTETFTGTQGSTDNIVTITGDTGYLHSYDTSFVPRNNISPDHFGFTISPSAGAKLNELDEAALRAFYERMKDQSANVATALAEGGQTLQMIGSTATRVAKSLLLAKRGNLAGSIKQLFPTSKKEVAGDWLQYQYGLKPLLQDLDGIAKHLANRSFRPKTYKVSAKRSETLEEDVLENAGVLNGVARVLTKVSVKYSAIVEIDQPKVREIAQLGGANPVSVAWELIPFSFIADWFIPIGDYLNNYDAIAGLIVKEVWKTKVVTTDVTYSGTISGRDSIIGTTWNSGSQRWQVQSYHVIRERLTSVPPLPIPVFKNPVSKGHLANALALFIQLRK